MAKRGGAFTISICIRAIIERMFDCRAWSRNRSSLNGGSRVGRNCSGHGQCRGARCSHPVTNSLRWGTCARCSNGCILPDMQEILENFRQNMIRNATALPGGFRARFLVEPLRWEAESAQSDLQGRVAVVLGAEILHEMEAMPWLAATVGSLLATPTARKRRESDAEREEDDDIGTVLRRCGLAVGCAFGGIFLGISPRSRRDAIDAFKSECKRWQDSETCLQVWEWFACDGCEGPLSPWRHTTRWSRDPETEPGDENEVRVPLTVSAETSVHVPECGSSAGALSCCGGESSSDPPRIIYTQNNRPSAPLLRGLSSYALQICSPLLNAAGA